MKKKDKTKNIINTTNNNHQQESGFYINGASSNASTYNNLNYTTTSTGSFTSLNNTEHFSNGHGQNSNELDATTVFLEESELHLNNQQVNQAAAQNTTSSNIDKDEVAGAAKTLMSFTHNINRNTITKRKNTYKNESSPSPSTSTGA